MNLHDEGIARFDVRATRSQRLKDHSFQAFPLILEKRRNQKPVNSTIQQNTVLMSLITWLANTL